MKSAQYATSAEITLYRIAQCPHHAAASSGPVIIVMIAPVAAREGASMLGRPWGRGRSAGGERRPLRHLADLNVGWCVKRITRRRFQSERSIGVGRTCAAEKGPSDIGRKATGHSGRSARWSISERRGHGWVAGGNRSKGLVPREGLAPRRVRGIVGSAGSPRPPAPARCGASASRLAA